MRVGPDKIFVSSILALDVQGADPVTPVAQGLVYAREDGRPYFRNATQVVYNVGMLGTPIDLSAEYANGNSGAAIAIDWTRGQKQSVRLTADEVAVTFTDPNGVGSFLLKVIQDGEGGRALNWPDHTWAAGGLAPLLTDTPNAVDFIALYFDGTIYHITGALLNSAVIA